MTDSRVIIRVCSAILTAATIALLAAALNLAPQDGGRLDPFRPASIINGVVTFTGFVLVLNTVVCPFLDNAHRPTCFYALLTMDISGLAISLGMSAYTLRSYHSQKNHLMKGLICSAGALLLATAVVLFIGLLKLQRHKLDFEDRNTHAHFALRIAEVFLFIAGGVLGCISTAPDNGKYDPKQVMFYVGFATLPVTLVTTYFARGFPQSRKELRRRFYILIVDILILGELITIAVVLSLDAGVESLKVIGGYIFIMTSVTQFAIITILVAEMYYCALDIQPRTEKKKRARESFDTIQFERA